MHPKIFVHGSYIGTTGFNNHTRDFFRSLSKHCTLRVRNFTIGSKWNWPSDTPHDGEPYLNDIDRSILYQQDLWTDSSKRESFKIYKSKEKDFVHDFNIVLNETDHHFFYDKYQGPKIAYNVWESTLLPKGYFDKLKEYDEVWVPSQWQKDCMVKQGMTEDFIKVVPEGVDSSVFFPEKVEPLEQYEDGRFKFILFGRWDYRKSTKEIIETFLKTFDKSEPVDLVVSIDNPWGEHLDGYKSTEERLENYGLLDDRIKIIHFPSREDYVKYLKTGHVFVSCARAEGWNLPLIEAMACGTPSIYSECSAQMEFAEGKGIPVKIVGETPANKNTYARFSMSEMVGNYYEPDFNDLSEKMRFVYEFYDEVKKTSIKESIDIRNKFNWDSIGEIGYEKCLDFYKKISSDEFQSKIKKNKTVVTYLDGPRVEVLGDVPELYYVEFCDQDGKVHHSQTIKNNMWTTCGIRYKKDWVIKVNGNIVDEFNLEGKDVLISLESKSIGDTIAWTPYAVEFAKKYKCKVILSTFHNKWFKGLEEYKDIEFIEPGSSISCYALYRLGWFRDKNNGWKNTDKHPSQVNLIPLQQTATDILGLDYQEINYGMNLKPLERPMEEKYVVFAPNATSGCKEWRYEYWVELSKMLIDKGYKVVTLTKSPFFIDNVENIFDEPMEVVANYLHHADKFIGLGSGLSWLNWGLGKHTYMINGFSKDGHEFTTNVTRIFNNVCIFCWNDEIFSFDAGDWDWCPVFKGTPKQHICQKSITPTQVFENLSL